MRRLAIPLVLLLVTGCQPAARFDPDPRDEAGKEGKGDKAEVGKDKLAPLDPGLQWQRPRLGWKPAAVVPIEFVSEDSDPKAWASLPKFWNEPTAAAAAALLVPSPLTAAAVASLPGQAVRIKVPRGLPDPRPYIPKANPPTLAKWRLGRELFFDKEWLYDKKQQSCADCHIPERNYTDSAPAHEGYNTPPLVNVVYNRHQFWDGRATDLEEVVQRTPEDEREGERTNGATHVWGGVIGRLRVNLRYRERFLDVFGTEPTQVALGQAIATYLRTLLAADSVYDRARARQRARGGKELESIDVEGAITEADLPLLDRKGKRPSAVAGDLFRGYRLFFDLVPERKTNCSRCHSGPLFSDGGFHNVGVGLEYGAKDAMWPETLGRFAHAPLAEKGARLVGAYKTPTLRGLARTSPYLHTGRAATIEDVVNRYNTLAGAYNPYLDPILLGGRTRDLPRELDLKEDEVADLALFLRGLTGPPVDAAVASPPPRSP